MGRPREFDREEVLAKAGEVFREKGYDATSIGDLVDRMGIGRASLYATFGSKQQLFADALTLYRTNLEECLLAPLRVEGSPREILERFFRGVIDDRCGGEKQSCLVLKSAVITAEGDETAAREVAEHMDALESHFRALIRRGRKAGEFGPGRGPAAMARFLTCSLQGLSVMACAGRDRRALLDIVRTTLATLAE